MYMIVLVYIECVISMNRLMIMAPRSKAGGGESLWIALNNIMSIEVGNETIVR